MTTTKLQESEELCHGTDTIRMTQLPQERIDDLETSVMMLRWSTKHLMAYIQWLHINGCIPAPYKTEADQVYECGETALAWSQEAAA